jgi:hypothetical protein
MAKAIFANVKMAAGSVPSLMDFTLMDAEGEKAFTETLKKKSPL